MSAQLIAGAGMQRHQHFVFALAATLTARALAQDLPPTDESLAAYADTTHSVTLADGREIHFVCMGAGSPTVVLTAGLGDWAANGATHAIQDVRPQAVIDAIVAVVAQARAGAAGD